MMQEKQAANVIEKALNEAGTCGLQHVWLLLLVSIPYLMVGANMGAIIFEGMTPSFQCNTSYSDWVQEVGNRTTCYLAVCLPYER